MRKSFYTLGAIVTHQMGLDLLSGSGFVFLNRRRTHLKMLLWEGDGFSLYYKKLEKGTFEHPAAGGGYELSYAKLLLILQGIETKNMHHRKRFSLAKS